MATEDLDPYGNFYFSLEIDGTEVAHFMEFSGLKTSATPYELQEGGLNGRTHRLPGMSKFENLTLKYATSASQQLAEWRDKYIKDEWTDRKNTSGSIVMRDNAGEEIKRYSFKELWPVSWEGPTMSAEGSALALETLECAYDGLIIDGGDPPTPPEPPPEPTPPEPEEPFASEPIQFEFDSDKMTPEGEAACSRVADSINNADDPPEILWIDAHTCTMGTWAYNLSLSNKRAAATAAKMKEECPTTVFHAMGFSWKYPVASNSNPAGRASNRRTDFFESSWDDRGVDASYPEGGKPS